MIMVSEVGIKSHWDKTLCGTRKSGLTGLTEARKTRLSYFARQRGHKEGRKEGRKEGALPPSTSFESLPAAKHG